MAQEKVFSIKAVQKVYSKSAPLLLLESVLFVIAAVLIFVRPLQILATLMLVFGIVLGVIGIYQLFVGFFGGNRENSSEKTLSLIFGTINIALGLVFFFQPVGSMFVMVYIFALLFLIKAIRTFILSLEMFRARAGYYFIDILISVGMAGLALLVLFYPKLGAVSAMYLIAITLLLYAFAGLHMYLELLRLKKKLFH